MDYQMPVRAIKNILNTELNDFYAHTQQALRDVGTHSDVPKELAYIGFTRCKEMLDNCDSYESLEAYISHAGYRMSLEEWINSL